MSFPDYTTWPGENDVLDRLTAANVSLRDVPFTDRMQAAINAVSAEIGRKTRRQFVPGAPGESRLYNGSGTSEQEVDELVTFTAASVIGLDAQPGYSLVNVILVQEQNLPQTRLVVGQGSLPAYSASGIYAPVCYIFPAGRLNILVTGTFGYAATIPADLWEAACGEMAVRLAREAISTPEGRLSLIKEGDSEKRFMLDDFNALWHDDYLDKVASYTRPSGRRLRNLYPKMI